MAIERYRAICIVNTTPMTVRTARWVILGIWILALVVSTPTFVEYSVYVYTHRVFVAPNQSIDSVADVSDLSGMGIVCPLGVNIPV